jgi:hypothetical protein
MESMIFRKSKEKPDGPQEATLDWCIDRHGEALLTDEPAETKSPCI